jgi:hypothetical protein
VADNGDFPWANLILFAIAMVLLFLGLRRAFKPDKRIVSKIFSALSIHDSRFTIHGFPAFCQLPSDL